MSYIIKSTSPFVSIKLTEKGRESLAKGQLNFASWAIGDSEINYDREAIVDANQTSPVLSGASKVMRPFDRQPNIKSFITTSSGNNLNPMDASNINVVKAIVNNEATERGFFSGSGINYNTLTGSTYMRSYATVSNTGITGNTSFVITGATVEVNDFIRLKLNNDVALAGTILENVVALPNLWYKVQSTAATVNGVMVTVDRRLPNLSGQTGSTSFAYVYRSGEVYEAFGYDTSTAYWDSGTLSFDSATNITCDDVKVWNMNNVWCENLAGITGLTGSSIYEDYTKFGSYSYLGTKYPYLDYLCNSTSAGLAFECNGPGFSYPDDVKKCISILHYTNNTISNLYGEFLYIDSTNGKDVVVTIPDIMYNRINVGTALANTMGMKFRTSGTTQFIGTSNIEYIPLIEDSSYVSNPMQVGKVFPQLKMVVFEDAEIVTALSYKSNRNWTLPSLSAVLTSPTGGTGTGVLAVDDTIYLTYALDNLDSTGLTQTLPCQNYIKVTNNSSSSKDISFKIEDVDLLPFMKKSDDVVAWNGYGFYATNFKLVYQIVQSQNDRPDPGLWKVYDYTNTGLTTTVGGKIDPYQLESQQPLLNGQPMFILDTVRDAAASMYDITVPLSMAPNSNPDILQFGDERFFYGNFETYIGATIFKTLFDIRINSSIYNTTTNPTRSTQPSTNPPDIKVTEVAIYDSSGEMVVIGKLSEPVALLAGNTIMLELSMDF